MHDIDRTQLEFTQEAPNFETEQYESVFGEFGSGEYGGTGEFGQQEWGGELTGEILSEAEQVELASELLGVTNEQELEQFLGNVFKKVAQAAGTVIRSPIGQAVGGVLKQAAKTALPLAGGALGAYFGGPLGAKIGSGLASAAGSALGLETEALEQEDREFEGAKQFVRLAADVAKTAASAPPGANPQRVAQAAALAAAQRLAPALVGAATGQAASASGAQGGMQPRHPCSHARHGRWVRRGNAIVLMGA